MFLFCPSPNAPPECESRNTRGCGVNFGASLRVVIGVTNANDEELTRVGTSAAAVCDVSSVAKGVRVSFGLVNAGVNMMHNDTRKRAIAPSVSSPSASAISP